MKASADTSKMKRQIYTMPDDIAEALADAGVSDAYDARPPYQQNDYVGWICRAKRAETRQKRMDQMIAELRLGGVYMRMVWKG